MLRRNEEMEYLDVEEGKLVVFDPESGDTHFIEGPGPDILKILEEETSIEDLVVQLSKKYLAEPGVIETDVMEFIGELKAKKVVKEL